MLCFGAPAQLRAQLLLQLLELKSRFLWAGRLIRHAKMRRPRATSLRDMLFTCHLRLGSSLVD